MTAEITNLEEFKDKFAALMAANVSLITAGLEPSRELSSKIIDEFVMQFMATTPMPAPRISAGWIVTSLPLHTVPSDFKGNYYESRADAQLAVTKFIGSKSYGRTSDYDIKEVFYFG